MKGNADTGVPIRVLLADDHAMFRQDLADVLAKYGAMEIVAEAPNDEDALRLARDLRPDSSDAEEAAFSKLHLKVQNHERKGSRGLLPIVVGTLILVKVERLPRGERRRKPRVLWLWWHGPKETVPDLDLIWRVYVRRFDLEHTFRFPKPEHGMYGASGQAPREQADRWTWLALKRSA